jgi:hypothetical protein
MNHIYDNPRTGPADKLAEAVERVLREEIADIVNIEATKAATEVERRIRDKVGGVATRVCNLIHFERHAQELIIRVDFSQAEKTNRIVP